MFSISLQNFCLSLLNLNSKKKRIFLHFSEKNQLPRCLWGGTVQCEFMSDELLFILCQKQKKHNTFCSDVSRSCLQGCQTCFPLCSSCSYQIKKSYSQRHQVFSHLEQSLGNTGCFHEVMTHSHQVEEAVGMEEVLPRGVQVHIPGEDS